MSTGVNVQSLHAIADLRASLVAFADAVGKTLDEVDLEVRRALQWIEHEQPDFWRREAMRAREAVTLARNEYERAQNAVFDGQRPTCYQQKKAFEDAKRRLAQAEAKIELVRRAAMAVRKESAEFQGRMNQLRDLATSSLPLSLSLLSRIIATLEAYAADSGGVSPSPRAGLTTGRATPATEASSEEHPDENAEPDDSSAKNAAPENSRGDEQATEPSGQSPDDTIAR